MNRNSEQQDHPRVCGEKSTPFGALWATLGSPPRVRGKVHEEVRNKLWFGITPACAGKRRLLLCPKCTKRDHPRVCGEKLFYAFYHVPCPGSPPRVRGKGIAYMRLSCLVRITPACAGKRHICKRYAMRRRDHPRVCGEKGRKNRFIFSHPGSPPRVRGKGKNTNRMGRTTGITPACAGKRK